MNGEWTRLVLYVAALGLGAVVLVRTRRACGWSAEFSRKAVHMGSGLMVLPLPWVFQRESPVFVLAGVTFAALLAVRLLPPLRQGHGQMLHAVQRESWGELCFPVVVALLFGLADGDRLLFAIPLLVLSLADAAAALVGVRWGRLRYGTAGSTKSWEGSLAFLLVAVACVYVPLTLAGRAQGTALLVAINVGLLTMLIEGASWTGLDNLFTPLLAFALLGTLELRPARELEVWLGMTASCAIFLRLWAARTSLDTGARFGAVVLLMTVWLLGGMTALVTPVLTFALYTLRWPKSRKETGAHDAQAVLSLCAPGLFWLIVFGRHDGLLAFHLAFAAVLPCLAVQRCAAGLSPLRLVSCSLVWSAIAWVLVYLPGVRLSLGVWNLRATGLGAIVAAALAFAAIRYGRLLSPPTSHRWIGLCAWIGSAL